MSIDLQALRGEFEQLLPEYLEDLKALVGIDSGTYDKAGVDRVGELLAGKYRELGGSITRHPNAEFGDSFTVSFEGSGGGNVLLLGHLDTVYEEGTAAARPWSTDGDRASAPGVADMKGGDLAIIYALRVLLPALNGEFGRITIVHNSDEEVGSPSSRDLIRREAEQADAVLVLEPGRENGDIVSARKGIATFDVEVRGVAAHAGVNHERGRSAALALAHIVTRMEGLNGKYPATTLNVGRIEAGTRPNVVPEAGSARAEARSFSMESLERIIEDVRSIVKNPGVDGTSATVEVRVEHHPMDRSPASAELVARAQQLAGELGFEVSDVATGGASDGNTAAAAGRPVLDGLGPVGGGAHSRGEYILVSSIVPRTVLLAGLIAGVASPERSA